MVHAFGPVAALTSAPKVVGPPRAALALGAAHAFAGSTQTLHTRASFAMRRCSRGHLTVENNELNKWAGRAMDDDAGYEANPFDKETAAVLLRTLTARSVRKLLAQLQELDLHQAQWLNNWASANASLMNNSDGNRFIQELFRAKSSVVVESTTQTSHSIDPQNLAHRLLQIRDDMARRATSALPQYVELANTTVLRAHLERSTFVSGSHQEEQKGRRRGYFGSRRGGGNGGGGA